MTEISNLLTWFSNNAPVCWPLTLPRSESFAWLGKAMKDQKGQESTKDNWSWDRLYCWITISRYAQQFWSCLIIMDIFGHFSSGVFQMKKPSNGRFHQQRQILRRTAEIRLQNLRGKKKSTSGWSRYIIFSFGIIWFNWQIGWLTCLFASDKFNYIKLSKSFWWLYRHLFFLTEDINQILELPLHAAGVPGQEELTQDNLRLGWSWVWDGATKKGWNWLKQTT